MKKRLLVLALTLCMALCLLPVAVQAETLADSGEEGGLAWSLSESGTLTISGTNNSGTKVIGRYGPWDSFRHEIKKIVIQDGVECIADWAFYVCDNMESISMADSVTYIGEHAFDSCHSLTKIEFSNNISNIGECAFGHCKGLKEVNLPDELLSISKQMFYGCESLETVTIPESVVSIEEGAFISCNKLETVFYEGDKSQWQGVKVDWTEHWPNEGNAPLKKATKHYRGVSKDHTMAYMYATVPTCTESGIEVYSCKSCGAEKRVSLENATGHSEVMIPKVEATCTEPGLTEGKYCSACREVLVVQEQIPATGHIPMVTAGREATCVESGLTEGEACSVCGTIFVAQEEIPALGHSWGEGATIQEPTSAAPGVMRYTCTVCGEVRDEPIAFDSLYVRIYGNDRFQTAFKVADAMKEQLGVEKFTSVIIASGVNFADALSGSYLSAVKNAPILLSFNEVYNDQVKAYIRENMTDDGTIYILGGTGAVPESITLGLERYDVRRLAGDDRFGTNLAILEEAGVAGKDILVCTGTGFADSLSASASKLPILLVWRDLTEDQKDFLATLDGNKLYIIGGEGAVSAKLEKQVSAYGEMTRLAGGNRFETSTLIAEAFFDAPTSAVLAYGWNFPDGLCGGGLAASMNAPLILTMERYEAAAAAYAQAKGIQNSMILGGAGLIPDASVRTIFALGEDIAITVK